MPRNAHKRTAGASPGPGATPRRASVGFSLKLAWPRGCSQESPIWKGEFDLDRYGRAASHLRRLLESLGLERKPRNVTPPSIEEYARHVLDRGVST